MGKGIFLVTEMMKNIIEALNQLGTEKIQEAGSVDALTAAIKGYGVEASPQQVQAALEAVMNAADGRHELDEKALAKVAGGISPAMVVPRIPGVLDGVKWVTDKIKGNLQKQENKTDSPVAAMDHQGKSITQTGNNKTDNVGVSKAS